MDREHLSAHIDGAWTDAMPTMEAYIRVPNQSPAFDPEWATNGLLDAATDLILDWCRAHAPSDMSVERVSLPGRTPLIHMHREGTGPRVLLYGHLDKQPPMLPWEGDLHPHEPVTRGDRLYGRGGADDGYAAFACLIAINALLDQGVELPPVDILIEACEESGSPDLPAYMAHLEAVLGIPALVVALDSGCGDYEHLWLTTSLRGMVAASLDVHVLTEGVHSGDASGVVPSSFRVARALLDRLEDSADGMVIPEWLHVEIPEERRAQAVVASEVIGDALWQRFPWHGRTEPPHGDRTELVLDRTWRPKLAVTGADGLPGAAHAGNVLRTHTQFALSIRLPPTLAAGPAGERLKALMEADAPHGASVTLAVHLPADGWASPPLAPWLDETLKAASEAHFGAPMLQMGEGGTIPFMAMLGQQFPEAQFLITGVLGPGSNAHGPNEFLHLGVVRKVTACVAEVLAVVPPQAS